MWFETPTELDRNFFSSLDKFCDLIKPTGNKIFDTYSKSIYKKNLLQRKNELVNRMRVLATKRNLLENYKRNIVIYEQKVREHNWAYQTMEQREKYQKIYSYLCLFNNSVKRKIEMDKISKEYFNCKNEVIAIETATQDEFYKNQLKNLKLADIYYQSLSRTFVNYLKAHPNTEFAKKHNLNVKNFNRTFFENHLEEIKNLNPERDIQKWFLNKNRNIRKTKKIIKKATLSGFFY